MPGGFRGSGLVGRVFGARHPVPFQRYTEPGGVESLAGPPGRATVAARKGTDCRERLKRSFPIPTPREGTEDFQSPVQF
jgi:hypothetical protein